jgi:hypothetical protein
MHPPTGEILLRQSERALAPRAQLLAKFAVAGRERLATCSGVSWFRGLHLAVVNLAGQSLRIYLFHPGEAGDRAPARLELLHQLTDGICYPEDVAVSPDGRLLAVTHSMTDGTGVSLRRIDPITLAPSPVGESLRRGMLGSAFHGLCFAPDSRHLAFTEVGAPGYIEVVRVDSPGRERTCLLENPHGPMKPKSVAFSPDARFVAVVWALNASPASGLAPAGLVSVHRYDGARGVIDVDAVAQLAGGDLALGTLEMCTFLPPAAGPSYRILAASQGADLVASFALDTEARTLACTGTFAGDLSFPHGIDASADGRFVAVTTYGDDMLRIDRVQSGDAIIRS